MSEHKTLTKSFPHIFFTVVYIHVFILELCYIWYIQITVDILFPSIYSYLSQIPYLGFCACEEMGETGVWQLVDPPILPLTHGPNHSFNWRETLLQDWEALQLLPSLLFLQRQQRRAYSHIITDLHYSTINGSCFLSHVLALLQYTSLTLS